MVTTISATELARNTAAALDAVAEGKHVVIERRGRVVAVLGPPTPPSGADVLGSMRGSFTERVGDDVLMEPVPDWATA